MDDFALVLGSASAILAMGLARLGTQRRVPRPRRRGPVRPALPRRDGGPRHRPLAGDPRRRAEDGPDGVDHVAERPRARHLPRGDRGADRRDAPDAALRGFDHLHSSSFFFQDGLRPGLPDLFARAHRAGLTTSLDTGFDPSGRWDGGLRATLERDRPVLPERGRARGDHRLRAPADGLRRLQNGRTRVVAKLGRDGAMTLEDGRLVHVPAFPVETIDTTGAGDSFNAGFLHAWLQRVPIEQCLRLGAACGALSTRGLGGTATPADARRGGGAAPPAAAVSTTVRPARPLRRAGPLRAASAATAGGSAACCSRRPSSTTSTGRR